MATRTSDSEEVRSQKLRRQKAVGSAKGGKAFGTTAFWMRQGAKRKSHAWWLSLSKPGVEIAAKHPVFRLVAELVDLG
jgi:hypothetical protein